MTLPASTPAPAGSLWRARIFCGVAALIALIEAFSAVVDLVVVGNITRTPDLSPRGLIMLAQMVVHLLLGLAALGFAVTGRLRFAVAALAVWALTRWARDLLIHGFFVVSPAADAANFGIALFTTFGQPLLCAAALAAAWRNRTLGTATLAVAALTVFDLASITIFAIGVSLYGYGP
jgi:hypothetical protein